MSYNNLYIVDNSNENRSVKKYLSDWCKISKQMDIATGYFEIGGMLELEEEWKHLDYEKQISIRIKCRRSWIIF
jgi:hypothetical protein